MISCGLVIGGDDTEGQYLRSFDPDAFGGRGRIDWTPDKAKAIRFKSMTEALAAWKTQSRVCPLRDDGRPNRPLTAFTVSLETEGAP